MNQFEQDPQPDHTQYIRKVTLPSGETIEVVSFEQVPGTTPDLHVCPGCASELVYPIDWAEAGPAHWEVSVRCPNCEWTFTGVYDEDVVQRFDEVLDEGTETLVANLRQLARANMEADVERFIEAIHADYLLPEDF